MGRKVKDVYGYGLLNDAELRIIRLHNLLKNGIKPWEYDYERYGDGDMDGKFYPDDWANLQAIDSMIADREGAAVSRMISQQEAAQR